jgi:hypothetical protein
MKFTTFRNLIIAGAASGLVGSVYFATKSQAVPPAPTTVVQTESAGPKPAASSPSEADAIPRPLAALAEGARAGQTDSPAPAKERATGQATASGKKLFSMRPLDEEIIRLFEQTPSSDKVKDATPNRPYKVNLYAEGGKYVRAKVDLNRNDKWDEKWSFDEKGGERIYKRQVSPSDDDQSYPDKYKLRNKMWEKTE